VVQRKRLSAMSLVVVVLCIVVRDSTVRDVTSDLCGNPKVCCLSHDAVDVRE
jgi:hypothetical protein